MAKKWPPSPPFSLRFTFEERAELEQAAGDMALAAYIRARVFEGGGSRKRSRGKHPVKDHKELARLLCALGDTRLASNVNQLAHAVNSGSLPVNPDTEHAIQQACADITWMRIALMKSLGLYEDDA